MEANSQNNLSPELTILEGQIRECYGRVVYTHKTQEKCADIILSRHNLVKNWQIGLSAITATSFISAFFGEKTVIGIALGSILAVLSTIINAYSKDYDLGSIAQKHSNSASQLWNVRESYLSLLTDIRLGRLNVDQITEKRDALQQELLNINKGAPRTIPRAYKAAGKALKEMEEMTFSDEEIDKFLPKELKRKV